MAIEYYHVDKIKDNPFQPRRRYGDIEALAAKIRAMREALPGTKGLIHVPTGREADGIVELAEGHRRLRAFRLLTADDGEYHYMPVNILDLDDRAMDDIAWDENLERADLTPVEEARALKRTLETRGLTQAQLGELRHLGRSTVANKLRLLRLPDDVLAAVEEGAINERQAMELLPALEILPADLAYARLSQNSNFNVYDFTPPTPAALKKRLLEFGNMTSDEIREVAKKINTRIEEASPKCC